ncbi:head GIN domain-containing protein [uncultured Draconibacterium sp.]|uniref:head GIN domain-containing protein n=1 Tax=uncultured Draconibacterium sp. TaxID=1573823 RepID=UPI0029C7E20C|nr:head GIN domain-containing protein [uncultured Draconibacterium sp.]
MKRALENQNEKKTYCSEFNRIPMKLNILNEVKTKVFLATILALGVLFTSCVKDHFEVIPSDKVTTTDFSASGISQLAVSDIFHVYVRFSETEESVRIEANENLHSFIEVNQTGDRLSVGLEKDTNISGTPVLNVYVTTASLSEVHSEGAASVEFYDALLNDQFQVELIGASYFKGSLETGIVNAYIEGASKMEIDGSCTTFQIDAIGASEMTGFDFVSDNLNADLDGGSEISLSVQQKLDVTARGASKVYYKGNGVIENQDLKDASEIINVN